MLPALTAVRRLEYGREDSDAQVAIPVTVSTLWGPSPRVVTIAQGVLALAAFVLMWPGLLTLARWALAKAGEKKKRLIIKP